MRTQKHEYDLWQTSLVKLCYNANIPIFPDYGFRKFKFHFNLNFNFISISILISIS